MTSWCARQCPGAAPVVGDVFLSGDGPAVPPDLFEEPNFQFVAQGLGESTKIVADGASRRRIDPKIGEMPQRGLCRVALFDQPLAVDTPGAEDADASAVPVAI